MTIFFVGLAGAFLILAATHLALPRRRRPTLSPHADALVALRRLQSPLRHSP